MTTLESFDRGDVLEQPRPADEPDDWAGMKLVAEVHPPSESNQGHHYTTSAYLDADGRYFYDCDCMGRRGPAKKCWHVKDLAHLVERVVLWPEMKPEAVPKKVPKRMQLIQEFLTRRQHRNSMVAWYDEDFQASLGDTYHDILELICRNPGRTRNDYVDMRGGNWNHTAPRITELMGSYLFEDGTVKGPTGQPRALIWPMPWIEYEMDRKR